MHFEADLEPTDSSSAPLSRDELRYRLRQQSLLGEFGSIAMQTRDLRKILQRATELCATGLQAAFAKVLEYESDDNRLMVRAGIGWLPGTIDDVSLAADIGSPAGYAYQTGESVISNHLEADTRFRTPKLLADHGIRRAINVLIEKGGEGKAFFGVLEVDSADPGQFDQDDANFLAGFAGLLGVAIERQQADARFQDALKHQALLTREMSHRVKNSLASVVGLLRVQARSAQSKDVENALQDASLRVSTIAEVHDHLWRSSHVGYVELADFMTELCKKLGAIGLLGIDADQDRRRLSSWSAASYGLMTALAGLNPWFWGLPALLVLAGFSMSVSNTSANSLLQATVSPALRGRAVSLYMLALQGGISIGSLLTGISVSLLGVRGALLINGILAVMAHLAIGRQWMRSNAPMPAF